MPDPYVITTKRPCASSCTEGLVPSSAHPTGEPCPECAGSGEEVSRCAVATLEKAQADLRDLIDERWEERNTNPRTGEPTVLSPIAPAAMAYTAARYSVDDLTESGGTVGPLPDGTVIKVVRVTPWRLASFTDVEWTKDTPVEDIVAAYNARKARS